MKLKIIIVTILISISSFAVEYFGADVGPESINVTTANTQALAGNVTHCKNCTSSLNGDGSKINGVSDTSTNESTEASIR